MKHPLYWIGIRESEICEACNLFAGSITIFGTGQNGNLAFERESMLRYDYNQDNDAWYQFVACKASEFVKDDPDCRFLLYDPDEAELYGTEVASRIVCQNPVSLLQLLSNKFQTRQWLSGSVPVLPYQMLYGTEISFDSLQESFQETAAFVIQSSYSCGGSGTWLLTRENQGDVLERLDPELQYAVSPYQEAGISPNIHMVLFEDDVVLFPPSVQLLEVNRHGITYKGADYPMYRMLPEESTQLLQAYARQIGDILRRAGYRGVCGADFLLSRNRLYFMEINARFQSSTFLLNRAIAEANWNTSIQALHLSAFRAETAPDLPKTLEVPFSFYHYAYEAAYRGQLRCVHTLLTENPEIDCIDDGLDWSTKLESGTYLFKAVFKGSVSAPGPEGECRYDGNVVFPAVGLPPEELKRDMERLKLLLLAHGVRLSRKAKEVLSAQGGFNHEEFDALDLTLQGHINICAPYDTNRYQLSPFCVDIARESDGGCVLTCYDAVIMEVQVRPADVSGEKWTCGGMLYHDITYLSSDRLRVYQRLGCFFKNRGTGCQFCDLPEDSRPLPLEDIYQAVDEYRDHPKVRHYLIGGGSNAPDDNFERVAQIAKYIRDTTGKPVYLMSLPPNDPAVFPYLKESGVTQVAFNLELFDRELALQYMPGKGSIPFAVYDRAFQTAVKLWGRTGDVRTIFIVGLEPMDSLLKGIDYAAGLGVSPILSLFRPAPGTPLQNFLPPPDREIWEIYRQAKAICGRHGMSLGPACPCCQENVLAITL